MGRKNRLLALAGLLLTISLATPTSVFCAGAPAGDASASITDSEITLIRFEKPNKDTLLIEMLRELADRPLCSPANLVDECVTEALLHTEIKSYLNPEDPKYSLEKCRDSIAKIEVLLEKNKELALTPEQKSSLNNTIINLNNYIKKKGSNNPWLRTIITPMINSLTSLANGTAAPSFPAAEPEALAPSSRAASPTASTTAMESTGRAGAGSSAGAASASTPAISQGPAGAGSGAGSYDTSREAYDAIKRKLARYTSEGPNAPAALFRNFALYISEATEAEQMISYGEDIGAILNAIMEKTTPRCLILMDAYGVVPTSADLELLEDVQETLALNFDEESSAAKSLLQVINKAREVMARPKAAVTTPASAGAGAGASAAATPLPAPLSAEERELLSARTHVLGLLEVYEPDKTDYRSRVHGESQEACRDRRANYIFDSFCLNIEPITNTVTLEGNQTTASILSSLRIAILSFRVMIEMGFLPSVDVVEKLKQIARKFALTKHPLFSSEQKEDALRLVREIKILLIKKGYGAKYWPECDVCSGRMTKQEASVNPDARICMDDGTARGAGAGAGSSGK